MLSPTIHLIFVGGDSREGEDEKHKDRECWNAILGKDVNKDCRWTTRALLHLDVIIPVVGRVVVAQAGRHAPRS